MIGRWSRIAVVVALIAALALVSGVAQAASKRVPVEGGFTCTLAVPDAQRLWATGKGISHFRGVPVTADWDEGSFTGGGSGVVNANLDADGVGHNWGSVVLSLNYDGLSGEFRETYSAQNIADGCAHGKAIFHGISGDFVGWQMMVDYKSVTVELFVEYRFEYWGYLIKP